MSALASVAVSYPSCLDWLPDLESWEVALGVLVGVLVALAVIVRLFSWIEGELGVPVPDRAGRHAGVALAGVLQRLDPTKDRARELVDLLEDDVALGHLRRRYRTCEVVDALFAIVYSVALASVVAFFATEAVAENDGTWPAAWLALAPLLLGLTDLVEDVLIITCVSIRGLALEHPLVRAASYASTAKTFLMAVTGGVVLSTILWWATSYF